MGAHEYKEKNSDQGGIRTHDLLVLIIVATPTKLQGQVILASALHGQRLMRNPLLIFKTIQG